MPVSFRILASRGLVYVRYEGFAQLDDGFALFAQYMRHPDFRPGQKQLVDLADVTGFERDYAKLFKMQAMKAGAFLTGDTQTLLVYHAPSEEAQRMCQLIARSWEQVPSVIARVLQHEDEALALLGQSETSIAELLEVTA
ncbi:MAG: hypothetical protein KDK24_12865 [Pseudooceanicola sp.]|nr:hypothetical protein [Pseudooceanicola sp.]